MKSEPESYISKIKEAADFLRETMDPFPRTAMVIGSGLGGFIEALEGKTAVDYSEIPHFPVSGVSGHAGRFITGFLEGKPLAVLSGRKHLYEGDPPGKAIFPIRVLGCLGMRVLILTNAAGALDPDFRPGDLMLISDHINLMFRNPLVGPHDEEWGPRFPDMSEPYDRELRELARSIALEAGIPLQEGAYVGNLGPSYETRAEVAYLRFIGAHAVGMSTIPEDIVARQMGMRVLGLTYISNSLVLPLETKTTHEEVLANAVKVQGKLITLIKGVMKRMESITGGGN